MKIVSRWLALAAVLAATSGALAQNAPYWKGDWEEGPCTDYTCYTDWSTAQAESSSEADIDLNTVLTGLQSMGAENLSSHGGHDFVTFATTTAAINAGKPFSKVGKEWLFPGGAAKNDIFGRPLQAVSPSGIDGSYSAWFFIPSNYQSTDWTIIFQFETTEQSPYKQDTQWWVNLRAGQTSKPLLHVDNAAAGVHNPANDVAAPLGRWFQIRADVYEGVGIAWYLDGVFWQSSSHATWPIGRDSDGVGTPQTFAFGVGHYGGVGRLYTDDAVFTPK